MESPFRYFADNAQKTGSCGAVPLFYAYQGDKLFLLDCGSLTRGGMALSGSPAVYVLPLGR